MARNAALRTLPAGVMVRRSGASENQTLVWALFGAALSSIDKRIYCDIMQHASGYYGRLHRRGMCYVGAQAQMDYRKGCRARGLDRRLRRRQGRSPAENIRQEEGG
ncbi:hypothetical protein BQ8482_110919 [Mesorhizobium delmotii]|uniref:Uncharacterized protein n=1 Tax=Mesorhizobium delmotii TaxID=1631247 RepID=A0A2P9ACX5_9HYPH|nr:hypothetical protein BQ8482_110919 [Mesorhizobium delmotii]